MAQQIAELKEKIAAKRQEIWNQEPEEMRVLKQTKFPKSNSFASVMYALGEIYHLTKNIYLYRNAIADGQVPFEAGLKMLSLQLDAGAQRYQTWKLTEASGLVTETAQALEQAQNIQEVKDLLDELLIYNNTLFVWLDSDIPWFKLGKEVSFI